MIWLKDSSGVPSATVTFSFISFIVVTFMVLTSLVKQLTLGPLVMTFNEPNVTLLTFYMGSTFGSYVYRRTTSDKLAAATPGVATSTPSP